MATMRVEPPTIFDEYSYLASYTDLMNVYGSNGTAATRHYVMKWLTMRAGATDIFDENHYIASNDSLISLFKFDRDAATQHYVETGYDLGLENR